MASSCRGRLGHAVSCNLPPQSLDPPPPAGNRTGNDTPEFRSFASTRDFDFKSYIVPQSRGGRKTEPIDPIHKGFGVRRYRLSVKEPADNSSIPGGQPNIHNKIAEIDLVIWFRVAEPLGLHGAGDCGSIE